jgi:hypothetical protein
MRLAGGTVSPRVFQQIGQEDEQARALAQRMQMFQAQQAMERERMALENAARGDVRNDRLMQFREGLIARKMELEEKHAARMAELEAKRASDSERMAANQQFQRELYTLRAQGQQDLARLVASLRPAQAPEPLAEVADPSSQTGRRLIPRSQAVGMPAPAPAGAGASGVKMPAEIQRMTIAMNSLDQGLDAYEKALGEFNPRNPLDQANPTKRAAIESLVADLRMQAKEAQALGALTGPDMLILEKLLRDPATMSGAYYGREGLKKQVDEARQSIRRRREGISKQFPGPAQPQPAAQTPANNDPLGLR